MLYTCISIGVLHRHDMKITSHMLKTGAHLQGDGKFESINAPVMEMKLDHVIPDQLHLILRVMDVFIQAHIDTMLAYDRHQHRLLCSHSSYKAFDGSMLNNLVMSIIKCGIYFCLYKQGDRSMK